VAAGAAAAFQGEGFDFAMARYNRNGTLDTSFGAGGIVKTDFGGGESIQALVLQSDGKLVAAGTSVIRPEGEPFVSSFALARYHRNGQLDRGFGTGGKVITSFTGNERAYALLVQPDGMLVAAGTSSSAETVGDFALARYNHDGSLDPLFGVGGRVTTDFVGMPDEANALVLQDGKLVAAGSAGTFEGSDFALARYNLDGSLDLRFGVNGKVTTTFDPGSDFNSHQILDLVLQDGKLVAGGSLMTGMIDSIQFDFGLARYNRDGTLDTRFGVDGRVITDFGGVEGANALALQADGKIVAAGWAEIGDTPADFALARYKKSDLGQPCAPDLGWPLPAHANEMGRTPPLRRMIQAVR
jgi:uncharacterized delta-60 repeat protein